ncbi:MAG TPA: C40 family peptidase [Mycobacteriales bacterium]|nr:C40 family peptidase [Mycobacteriales bacterium]
MALTATSACLTSGALAFAPPSVAANGGSVGTVKARIGSVQHRLRVLNVKVEAASERYDAARDKLATAQQTAAIAQQALAKAETKANALQKSVTAFAVAAYRGDTINPLLTLTDTGSAGLMVSRMTSLQAVSESQAAKLVEVAAARRAEEEAKATSSAALAAQQADVKAVAAARSQILSAAAQAERLLGQLRAKERAIIKAAKARRARLAAERRAAALAAQQIAERRAAEQLRSAPPAQAPAPAPAPAPVSSGPVAASGGAKVAVEWAYRELGKPYVWAAAGPNSFDCSGLTMYVWGKAGVALGHFTGDQWNEGTHVSQSQLEPGDLVFFAYNVHNASTIHHVGIYVGGGNMIDAPFTGADVRVEPYDRSDYIGAVRPG